MHSRYAFDAAVVSAINSLSEVLLKTMDEVNQLNSAFDDLKSTEASNLSTLKTAMEGAFTRLSDQITAAQSGQVSLADVQNAIASEKQSFSAAIQPLIDEANATAQPTQTSTPTPAPTTDTPASDQANTPS